MFVNKLRSKIASRSEAASAAIANAKAVADNYGLRRVIDNGEPRCLFDARGDECVVTIVNVAKYAPQFKAAGFAAARNMFEPAFEFSPDRMAEVAAIVGLV